MPDTAKTSWVVGADPFPQGPVNERVLALTLERLREATSGLEPGDSVEIPMKYFMSYGFALGLSAEQLSTTFTLDYRGVYLRSTRG